MKKWLVVSCLISASLISCVSRQTKNWQIPITAETKLTEQELGEYAFWQRRLQFSRRAITNREKETYVASNFSRIGLTPLGDAQSFAMQRSPGTAIVGMRTARIESRTNGWIVVAADINDCVALASLVTLAQQVSGEDLPRSVVFLGYSTGQAVEYLEAIKSTATISGKLIGQEPSSVLDITGQTLLNTFSTIEMATLINGSVASRAARTAAEQLPDFVRVSHRAEKGLNAKINYIPGPKGAPFDVELGSQIVRALWQALGVLLQG